MAASRGVSQRYLDEIQTMGLGECLCPEVFWGGHRMQARNTTQCPRMPDIVEGLGAPVAHACIPLRFDKGSRGVVVIGSPDSARPHRLIAQVRTSPLTRAGTPRSPCRVRCSSGASHP